MKSPIVLLEAVFKDLKRLMPCVKGLDRDLVTIKNRFEHEGYSFLAVTLCTMGDAVDYGLEHGTFACPSSFSKKGALPKLFSGLLCEVFDSQGQLKSDPSVECIMSIRQLTRLFKKMELTSARNKELHDAAVSTFVETDDVLARLNFDDRMSHHLELVSSLVLASLQNFTGGEEVDYRHGPGGVYERVTGNSKWKRLFESLALESVDPSAIGHGDFLYNSCKELSLEPFAHRLSYGGKARLISVPKTASAVRTITVEPLLNQYIQQGLNTVLRQEIEKCSILRQCLSLTDQSKNQKLALEGSQTGYWTTIDLSSASDLLSVKLVKIIFGPHSDFLSSLMSSRSTVIESEKLILPLHKYAGMGNATTFPVQSVCFAVLCIAAILDQDGVKPSYWNCKRAAASVQVYGDDIIVPSAYYHTVRQWFQSFALRVNEKKTFSKGKFRESCGCDAYDGVDITPTYVRADPLTIARTTSSIASFVSAANQFWLKGYYETSDLIKKHVEKRLKRRLPLVNPNSGLLGWIDRYGSSEYHSWCPILHTPLIKGLMIVPKNRKDHIDGYPALLKFFNTSLIERRVNHLEVSVIRFKSRIIERRVPAFAGL